MNSYSHVIAWRFISCVENDKQAIVCPGFLFVLLLSSYFFHFCFESALRYNARNQKERKKERERKKKKKREGERKLLLALALGDAPEVGQGACVQIDSLATRNG